MKGPPFVLYTCTKFNILWVICKISCCQRPCYNALQELFQYTCQLIILLLISGFHSDSPDCHTTLRMVIIFIKAAFGLTLIPPTGYGALSDACTICPFPR